MGKTKLRETLIKRERERERERALYIYIYIYILCDAVINGKMLIAKWREKKLVGPMIWPLMWLNRTVATINTFQLLDMYRL